MKLGVIMLLFILSISLLNFNTFSKTFFFIFLWKARTLAKLGLLFPYYVTWAKMLMFMFLSDG